MTNESSLQQRLWRTLALVVLLAVPLTSFSQSYPTKPIRLVVPFDPGGATDILGRLVCVELTLALSQPCIVENRSGGGGNIGTGLVVNADPDGYTLLVGAAGNITINPSLFAKMPFDPAKDLAPVALVASTMNVLVVRPSLAANSLKDLIELARKNPGKLTYASAGVGGTQHLSAELFKKAAGVEAVHVPYKGSSPAMVGLLGDQTDMMFDNMPSALPRVQAGSLRALAVTGKVRSKHLPNVPTVHEAGIPNFEATSWFGIFAPSQTPPAVIERLHGAIDAALKKPAVLERISTLGAEAQPLSPSEFRALIAADTVKWREAVKQSGARVE